MLWFMVHFVLGPLSRPPEKKKTSQKAYSTKPFAVIIISSYIEFKCNDSCMGISIKQAGSHIIMIARIQQHLRDTSKQDLRHGD